MSASGRLFRFITLIFLGSIISLLLFVMMQKMLQFERQRNVSPSMANSLDFVHLIREQQAVEQRRPTQLPKQPEPPKTKKPPPKMPKVQVKTPKVEAIELSAPRLSTRLDLNDALYLGDFKREVPKQQVLKVDEEVVPLVRIAPLYPSRAARLGIEGWVKMKLVINSKGGVDSVTVLESMPARIFDRAAIKAIKRWRFRPKIVDGKAVSRTAEQQIQFKLSQ